jgi:hypothetical protein
MRTRGRLTWRLRNRIPATYVERPMWHEDQKAGSWCAFVGGLPFVFAGVVGAGVALTLVSGTAQFLVFALVFCSLRWLFRRAGGQDYCRERAARPGSGTPMRTGDGHD